MSAHVIPPHRVCSADGHGSPHASELNALAAEYGYDRLAVFGSIARGQARADSDIDLLVEPPQGSSSFDFVECQLLLEQVLGREIDLSSWASLKARLGRLVPSQQGEPFLPMLSFRRCQLIPQLEQHLSCRFGSVPDCCCELFTSPSRTTGIDDGLKLWSHINSQLHLEHL